MKTNDLCNVRGYLDPFRITAIHGDDVVVETEAGLMWVHYTQVTRSWSSETKQSGDYVPMSFHVEEPEEGE